MPELPEVHTTTTQLKKEVVGKTISNIWSDYHQSAAPKKGTVKDPHFYSWFAGVVKGSKIKDVERRGKNILIHLTGGQTVLIHMKMTGHLLFGNYQRVDGGHKFPLPSSKQEKWEDEEWIPVTKEDSPLWDSFNRFIHLVFIFSDKKNLVLSDVRKFAKVTLLETRKISDSAEISDIGPDPRKLKPEGFINLIKNRRSGKIKQVLMNQSVISGVGNIYSDEALWEAKIHPETDVQKISASRLKKLKKCLDGVLKKGIESGGDSDSDYRNLYGQKGRYQNKHRVYRKTGDVCKRRGCSGIIKRIKVGGRSAHFCPKCQKK